MPKFISIGKEDPMSTFCRMVEQIEYEDLPGKVVDFAKRHILDTMGVTIGGSSREGVSTVVDFVKEQGGKGESLIPVYGGKKVPASMAAFAIGVMSRAMDMGDVHEESMHSAEYTFPALLAATGLKDKVSGKEFITAFVVGQEVQIRIGMAYRIISSGAVANNEGGHYIFGAVAATAKLLGLSLEELQNAEGIARCMTQPHDNAMFYPPTLMVRVHHGFIAQDAINACLLAKRGISGPSVEVLTGPRGFLTQFSKWGTDASVLTKELGQKWEMTSTMMKPYASCKCTHTAVDGILDQMKKHGFKFDEIATIHIDESSVNWVVVGIPYEMRWNPQTEPDCQFSLPYVVATAARDKKVFVDSYTPEARARKETRDLMTRISAKEDSSLPPWAARVTTVLRNGSKYSGEYTYVKGHPKNPFTDQELIDKFKACAAYSAYKLSDAVVNSLIGALLNLEEVDDVNAALISPLTPS